jgi:signal transduction histidine kinase
MSLRRRFVILGLLAILAVGAAVATIAQLFTRTDNAREQAGRDTADAMVSALERAEVSSDAREHEDDASLRSVAAGVVAAQIDAHAGFCTGAAVVIAVASPGPRRELRHAELPPDQRDTVRRACGSATTGVALHERLEHPHDVVVISATRLSSQLSAWALVRVPTHPEEGPQLPVGLAVMALATLALAILTVEAVVALRGGAGALELALSRLREDLRAELPTPRPQELARVADGLRSMASRLADAHDRELALERDLSHQQRLAGLGRVTAGVAHEIRNPLAAIKLKLDGLMRRTLDERTHADVRVCLQEVGRLDEIIGAMLLVARKTPARPELLSLGGLTDERMSLLRELAEERRVTLLRGGDAKALANRITLTRALDNLLRNAIDASPPDGAVHVTLANSDAKATIDVRDDGPGVPQERTAELFEPFFTTKPEGTGLGLWLSRSLLELDAGTLAYERESEQTHFIVTLPAPNAKDDSEHPYR